MWERRRGRLRRRAAFPPILPHRTEREGGERARGAEGREGMRDSRTDHEALPLAAPPAACDASLLTDRSSRQQNRCSNRGGECAEARLTAQRFPATAPAPPRREKGRAAAGADRPPYIPAKPRSATELNRLNWETVEAGESDRSARARGYVGAERDRLWARRFPPPPLDGEGGRERAWRERGTEQPASRLSNLWLPPELTMASVSVN